MRDYHPRSPDEIRESTEPAPRVLIHHVAGSTYLHGSLH